MKDLQKLKDAEKSASDIVKRIGFYCFGTVTGITIGRVLSNQDILRASLSVLFLLIGFYLIFYVSR